jgi:hypothetical protein
MIQKNNQSLLNMQAYTKILIATISMLASHSKDTCLKYFYFCKILL